MSDSIALSVAKQHLGSLVDRAHLRGETLYLTRHGRRIAALVDADTYAEMLERLEDFEDAQAAHSARKELDNQDRIPIPWDEVKADLGLG